MKPVDRLLTGFKTCPSLLLSGRVLFPYLRRQFFILGSPSVANYKNITNFDMTTLRFGSYVKTLVFATSFKFLEWYSMPIEAIVPFPFLLGIAPVVEQDCSTTDAVL